VKIGDELTVQLEVTAKREARKSVTLDCVVINQHGKTVANGTAEVMP
jgi:acyl dehydratase